MVEAASKSFFWLQSLCIFYLRYQGVEADVETEVIFSSAFSLFSPSLAEDLGASLVATAQPRGPRFSLCPHLMCPSFSVSSAEKKRNWAEGSP